MFDFFTFLKENPGIGYLVVFLGSMIEGETIVLGASALAAVGYLSIEKVGILAFISTLFADQVLFFVGHHIYKKPGRPISERFPKLYKKSKKAVILLKKYDIWFILMFRFVYGIRSISPVVIGLCGTAPKRFIPLNLISAFIWATLSCGIGYWLGDFLFDTENGVVISKNMHRLQYYLILIVIMIISVVLLSRFLTKWKSHRSLKIPDATPKKTEAAPEDFPVTTLPKTPDQP